MKKCLIFADFSHDGGTGSYMKDLIMLHKKNNIQTFLIAEDRCFSPLFSQFLDNNKIAYKVINNRPSVFLKSYLSLLFDFFCLVKYIFYYKPDFLVLSTSKSGDYFLFFLFNMPFVYILHTPACEKTSLNKFMFIIPSFFSNKNKIFIAVSDFVKKSIELNWEINKDHIKRIYNCSRIGYSRPLENGCSILTIGHLETYKNPDLWLEIAVNITSKFPKVNFFWVGSGSRLSEFKLKAEKFNRINFVGYSSDVFGYYSNSILYLQPSIKESLGISVLDAMANGLPCIVSDVEGLPETTIDGITGFICNNNSIESYLRNIELLLTDDKLRSKLAENAIEFVHKKFDKKIWESAIIDQYNSILN